MYRVVFTDDAERDLERLDPKVRGRLLKRLAWFEENAERIRHEPLTGQLGGLFKFRVGDYRILYDLIEADQTILIHAVGHRRDIYR